MYIISHPVCVECIFNPNTEAISRRYSSCLTVYYARTKDISSRYPDLKHIISADEQLRADKFHFEDDRVTYISCHALLRIIIAKYLVINPLEIAYIYNKDNKPELFDAGLNFNITHSKEAFAIGISKDFPLGIDIENVDQNIDIELVARSVFSLKEREYIFGPISSVKERFFLLWTRKEALLKAIGTGIIDDIARVEVYKRENVIEMNSFANLTEKHLYRRYFIYSVKLEDYYLSIALPHKVSIEFYNLNDVNVSSYLGY